MSKTLKKKAWKLMSKYIRLKYADKNGKCSCVTCGKKEHWKKMQAGHFIDSRNNSVLFDDRLIYPQCVGCNMFKKGNKVAYTLFMLKQGYSEKDIEEMLKMKHLQRKIYDFEYNDLIDSLKDKLVGLDMKRGEYD